MTSARGSDAAPQAKRLREWIVWCLPALIFGGWLRIELLHGWQAGLYFGPDSASYWETAFRFVQGGPFEVNDKRPWLYPVIVWLAGHGPVSPAFSVALLQQTAAWLSILALGALIRAIVPFWKWFIIPATLLYAGQPEILYWGHVLIADSLFISLALVVALVVARYWRAPSWRRLAIVMALVFLEMAMRPVGRAFWLSMIPIAVLAPQIPWREKLLHAGALAVLYFPASAATSVRQGEDLLFLSTLPLMRLDTPLHADLKAELRPQVEAARADIWSYITVGQRQVWGELIDDDQSGLGPVMRGLRADKKRYTKVRSEISREALAHAPLTYAGMIAMKTYAVYGLNDTNDRLAPDRWASGEEKFLDRSFGKLDPKFPGYMLGNSRITDTATLHQGIADTLSAKGSQSRILATLDLFERVTAPFSLLGKWPDRWWWIIPVALGVLVFPWTQDGRRLWPILILTAGYLGMTFLVGRAVGRYRLPVEFALYISASGGLSMVPYQLKKSRCA